MASKYFVGTGNWNDTNRWATSSGGPGGTGVPAFGDDVYFDTNSGDCTVNVTVGNTTSTSGMLSINFTGYTSTITMSNNIHIAIGGTVSIDSTNVNTLGTAPLYINNTVTLTSGGGTWGGNVTFAGGTTKTLTSDFTVLGTTTCATGSSVTLSGSAYKYYTNGITATVGVVGNSTIALSGGTWSGAATISTNLHFGGNVTISGGVNWSPTVANGAATMKYVSGAVDAGTSTITTLLTTTTGITIFDTDGMDLYNLTLSNVTNPFMTINSPLNVTNTITSNISGTLTINGTSNFDSTGTLSIVNTMSISSSNDMTIGVLTKGVAQLTMNGFTLTVNGNLVVGTGAILGTGTVKLGGGGTWTSGGGTGVIRNSVEFVGNYTVSGTVYWSPTVANGAATLKYTSGTITTAGSTLNTVLVTTASIANFDTNTMVWNNITMPAVAGTAQPNFVSDLRVSGILTIQQASGNTFAPTGSGAIRMIGTGNYLAIAGSTHTLNTDWYFENWTFNAYILNGNRIYITGSITPNGNVALGSASGGTTEIVMQNGTVTGSGAFLFQSNLPFTINPSASNTVTFSVTGGFREGANVAKTLKFDTNGGGTFNAGTAAISFGNTASTLTIDLSGAGIINLDSCTISNTGTVVMTISVTPGSASFNSGTSTLNISLGGTTLNTQGIHWFNITTAAHTHTLNSSLVSIGTFRMNAVSTFTNGNLYWDPRGTLIFGTGGVGFIFNVPRTVTVQNLSINSAGGMVLNTNTINVTGNLTMLGAATAVGTTQINLIGTGTWSNVLGPTTWLRNPVTINTSGTITLGATIAVINTTTYSAGTIDSVTNSNTLNVFDTTLVGFGSNSSSYLNNLTFHGGTTVNLTINTSAAYFLGTVTTQGNTSFTATSSSTFGFSTNILSFLVPPSTHTFKALTEYFVRGQLNIFGRPGISTITVRSSAPATATRTKITLLYGATQKVYYTTTAAVDSSGGQTVWDYKGTIDSDTINWRLLPTPGTISSTFAY